MYSVNPLDYSFGHIDSFYWDLSWRPFGATNEKRTQTIYSEISPRVFCWCDDCRISLVFAPTLY